jgi:dihydrolipoamide dehydrogenase
MDRDLVRVVSRTLDAEAASVYLHAKARGAKRQDGRMVVTAETQAGEASIPADIVLVAVGRRPVTTGLGLEEVGVKIGPQGFIETDTSLHTNVPGVYAIGDVRGPPFLAHKASKEGIVAAEAIAGLPSELDYQALPDAVFTDPEIATVGVSETKARATGRDFVLGRFPFSASGRALTSAETDGFVKVIAEKKSGRVLGVAIVGPEASDLISEAALAIEMGATAEDIALTIHPHPTLPESLMEAAEGALGRAIHQLRL